MSRTPSSVAARRIQTELNDWLRSPPDGCKLENFDNMLHWTVVMQGPESTEWMPSLYEGETYRLSIKFTGSYPLEPPEIMFIPPSPVHPHIYTNGHVCLDILYDGRNGGWSPALTMSKVVISLRSMLASNTEKHRPPGDSEYCSRTNGRSPKETQWMFDDNTV